MRNNPDIASMKSVAGLGTATCSVSEHLLRAPYFVAPEVTAFRQGEGSHPDRVLNKKETAALFGVSERTVDRISQRNGGLRKIQLSPGRVGFRQSDVQAWLQTRCAA